VADLFGAGLAYPVEVDSGGRLVARSGEQRIGESIQRVLDARRYECPLDPNFGIEPSLYDPIADPAASAYQIGLAVASAEPRLAKLTVLPEPSPDDDTIRALMRYRIASDNNAENRVDELYALTEVG
jgi:hypothetical protein